MGSEMCIRDSKTPDQLKRRFALWSAQAVRLLIRQNFGIDMPSRTVRKYLNRWGFTPQRPMKRAYERDPKAVEQWLKTDFPAIAARAKAEGGEIHWGDETAASNLLYVVRKAVTRGYQFIELFLVQQQRFSLVNGAVRGGVGRVGEEGVFAKMLARAECAHHLFATRPSVNYLNLPVDDDVQMGARLPLAHNEFIGGYLQMLQTGIHSRQLLRTQATK